MKTKLDKNAVILFQGDEITDGGRVRGNDPNHVMGHGYAYNVGSYLGYTYAEKQFGIFNRGVAGDTVTTISDRWDAEVIDMKPDVLSILLGLNDVPTDYEDGDEKAKEASLEYGKKLTALVKRTLENLPDCRIVILEPFALPLERIWKLRPGEGEEEGFRSHYSIDSKDCFRSFAVANNMKYFREEARKVAEANKLIFVPLQEEFDKAVQRVDGCYWLWDGAHPTYSGHDLISEKWLKTVSEEIEF